MKLPKILEEQLDLSCVKDKPIGFSFEEVYLIDHGYQQHDVVLKMSARHEVYEEGENLRWLKNKISVPEIYFNFYHEGKYYLVMEKCGQMMFQDRLSLEHLREDLMYFGRLIRSFHNIDPHGLPYDHCLQHKLDHVRNNVLHDLVRTQYFERELQGRSGQQLYDQMMKLYPFEEDLVLCHGDASMPNIMVDDQRAYFIDVTGMGIVDRHLDLAIAFRTIRYNIEAMHLTWHLKYLTWFMEGYGKEKVDPSKIEFFILLDELTNG